MTRAYLALAAICIIWGTTYTAIKFAVSDFPPFLLVGIRQSMAGMLLLSLAAAKGKTFRSDRKYLLRQMFTGFFTITGGNGFVTWGMQFVSSGLAAIIGSLTPVAVVLINIAWRGAEMINARVIAGVLLGFGGLGLVFHDGWLDFLRVEYRWGIVACFASCFSWSLGTVMAKRWNNTAASPLYNAGLQLTAGGLGSIVLHFLFNPSAQIHHTTAGWLAIFYLVTIGSALAFTLYTYVLSHLSATVSSLYTYINPVVAIFLGWIFLGEHLTFWTVLGMAITIVGVWLVNSGQRRRLRA